MMIGQTESRTTYVLGLDLGVSSLGWALVTGAKPGSDGRVIRAGTHLFEAGIDGGKQDPESAMATGREKSRALPRRDARQQRRQTWRRAFRKRALLNTLIRHELLPTPEQRLVSPDEIDAYLKKLDKKLRAAWENGLDHRSRQLLPYRLRAAAIEGRLEAYEIGRALYHLAQRRGFLSNRKADNEEATDDEKNAGKVVQAIDELKGMLAQNDDKPQTLGQFFASLNPCDASQQRIRGRWTSRQMYEYEFGRIWEGQSKFHAALLTEDACREIKRCIFRQRPLKSNRHLIGRCSLMPSKRRAPLADRLVQYFRILQTVNDLEIIPQLRQDLEDIDPKTGKSKLVRRLVPDPTQRQRPLTAEERKAAIERLSLGDATFNQLRQAGAGPKDSRFNFESGGVSSKLAGLRTDEKLRAVFGDRWIECSEAEKDLAVSDCLSIVRADVMHKRGRRYWNLTEEQARAFTKIKLEEGYANISRAAIRRLLPVLEAGTRYATARRALFPESFQPVESLNLLPQLDQAFKEPVSPAVARALSEMRRVVNAIIRRYGKPEHIRIELARDLKKGRKRREAISKQIATRRSQRELAASRLLREYPHRGTKPEDVSATDILKVLLADECNWLCPYTGRSFGWNDLFGPTPTMDIEHIWPFSRSLDDSFLNKTLCCVTENRQIKRNRLPAEAYSKDRLDEMCQRVTRFKGDARDAKLDRFRAESIPDGFTNRHLSESRYISRKAAEYLALLYGGFSDEEHKRRVHVPSGGVTAWLRREWGMNAILSDRDEKDRADHRHHAIDAIVIAHTNPAMVKKLQESAATAEEMGSHRRFSGLAAPFDITEAMRAVQAIVVSHRQNRKARGKFHNDTIYSKPLPTANRQCGHRIRKELDKLKEREFDAIVDPRIRAVVRSAYERRKMSGARTPEQAFSEREFLPQLSNGERIRKVRLYSNAKPQRLGLSVSERKKRGLSKQRHVDLRKNHHTVILAKVDSTGREIRWVDEPVSLLEAMTRVKERRPLVSREAPDGYCFKFSLAANDYIEMDHVSAKARIIYRILSISKGDIEIVKHSDGRIAKDRKAANERERIPGQTLLSRNARKVHVNYLGEVKNAGG
ncbi:MAG: type II CRISPR RNA-guided endonuclease Cas9 [Phycisphaeraceae bacterium]|nr:type II CRISPR RNA-guided endonuclease Cas9 [Phycisphaeraceae bacterium]